MFYEQIDKMIIENDISKKKYLFVVVAIPIFEHFLNIFFGNLKIYITYIHKIHTTTISSNFLALLNYFLIRIINLNIIQKIRDSVKKLSSNYTHQNDV